MDILQSKKYIEPSLIPVFIQSDNIEADKPFEKESNNSKLKLIHTQKRTLSLKCFREEIRATRDVDTFLTDPAIIPDETDINLDNICSNLLHKILGQDVNDTDIANIRKSLFTIQENEKLSNNVLRETTQAVFLTESGEIQYKQNFVVLMSQCTHILKQKIGISRLSKPLNLGDHCAEVRGVILILTNPNIEGTTKSAAEISRTFATVFSDWSFMQDFCDLNSPDEESVVNLLKRQFEKNKETGLSKEVAQYTKLERVDKRDALGDYPIWHFGKGIWYDITNRLPYYVSDFTDAFTDTRTIQKVLSAAIFIYFACLLPSIAFGNLNAEHTDNWLNVERTLISQTLAGVVFAMFSAQPLLIMLTTAPIALYITSK